MDAGTLSNLAGHDVDANIATLSGGGGDLCYY